MTQLDKSLQKQRQDLRVTCTWTERCTLLFQGRVTENDDSLEKKILPAAESSSVLLQQVKMSGVKNKKKKKREVLLRQQVGDNEMFTHDSWDSLTLVLDFRFQVLQDFSQRAA